HDARHRPLGLRRKSGKHQAFDHEDQPERGQEIFHSKRATLTSRRGGCRRLGARLAGWIVEEAEEASVRLEQKARVGMLEAGLVSLHRAVEGEKVRVLVECVGKNLVAGGVAFAADLLGL